MAMLDVSPDVARVLDLPNTLANLGGDPDLLQEIMTFFVDLMPQQLDDLAAAVAARDVAAVGLQAHGMKGGAGNVGAVRIAAAARELEALAKGGGLIGAEALVDRLRAEFRDLREALPNLDWAKLA